MTREAFRASEVKVGDQVVYPAILRPEHKQTRSAPLRVSRVANRNIYGYKVEPAEWEQDVEFHIGGLQLEDNGVLVG